VSEILRGELNQKVPPAAFSRGSQNDAELDERVETPPMVFEGAFQRVILKTDRVVVERLSPTSVCLKMKRGGGPVCMEAPLKGTPSRDWSEITITDGEWIFAEATKRTSYPPNGSFLCGDIKFEITPKQLKLVSAKFTASTQREGAGTVSHTMFSFNGNKWLDHGFSDGHVYLAWKRRDLGVLPKPIDGGAFQITVSSTREEPLEIQYSSFGSN
jgi:hypothetical protein